jgi:hypothetical protein
MKLGDRVYHTGINANGYIADIDNTKQNPYKVVFFWAKYCDVLHGAWRGERRSDRKWQWCSADSLVPGVYFPHGHKVSTIGGRSLDRLVRNVCELPRRQHHDGSDIVIGYGQSNHAIPSNILMINRHLVMDKFKQCKIMGEELTPEVREYGSVEDGNWIIKPRISMGGRGIRRDDGECLNHGEYFQREFNKVREFRTHCFMWMDEPVTFIQEKIIYDKNQLCWNKKQGGAFQYPYQEGLEYGRYLGNISLTNINIMKKMSVEALKKLKYDMGGIDFGMDAQGNFKIFEVNSRMGLRERSFFTYKNAFQSLKVLDINSYKQKRGW